MAVAPVLGCSGWAESWIRCVSTAAALPRGACAALTPRSCLPLGALQAAAAKVGKKARVLIRINPDVDPQVPVPPACTER